MSNGFLFIEGFEGDTESLVWTSMIPQTSTGMTGGRRAEYARTGNYGIGVTGVGLYAAASPLWGWGSVIVGFAFRWTALGGGDNIILALRGPGDSEYLQLGVDGQRCLVVYSAYGPNDGTDPLADWNSTVTVRARSTFQLDAGAWYYIELCATPGKHGAIYVQVNGPPGGAGTTGAEVISVPDVRTTSNTGTFNQFRVGTLGGFLNESRDVAFDDFYVRQAGAGFIGDNAVFLIDLEDDRTVEWTRLSGAKNYLMVNENTPDEDTTYNGTDTDGAEDIFEIADQTFTGDIHCLQLVARNRKTETEAWQMETMLELDGTKSYSPTRFLPYPNYETRPPDVFGDAPGKTGWTLADLNAVGVGYRAGPAPES